MKYLELVNLLLVAGNKKGWSQ